LLEKGGLAGAGTGDQADHADSGSLETLAQRSRGHVVLLQDMLPHLDQAGSAHDSISRATTSSSRPLRMDGVGLPQTGQHSRAGEAIARSAAQASQYAVSGTSSITNSVWSKPDPSRASAYADFKAALTTPESGPRRRWIARRQAPTCFAISSPAASRMLSAM